MNQQTIEFDFSKNLNQTLTKFLHASTLLFYSVNERFFTCSADRDLIVHVIFMTVIQDPTNLVSIRLQFKKHT